MCAAGSREHGVFLWIVFFCVLRIGHICKRATHCTLARTVDAFDAAFSNVSEMHFVKAADDDAVRQSLPSLHIVVSVRHRRLLVSQHTHDTTHVMCPRRVSVPYFLCVVHVLCVFLAGRCCRALTVMGTSYDVSHVSNFRLNRSTV